MNVKTTLEQPVNHDRCPSRVNDWLEAMIERVRAEYREMPGLCLTVQQGSRFWHIDATACTRIFEALVAERVLRRTAAGAFIAEV